MRARTRTRCLVFHRRKVLPNRRARHPMNDTSAQGCSRPCHEFDDDGTQLHSLRQQELKQRIKKRSFVNSIYRKTIHKHPSLLKKTSYVKKEQRKKKRKHGLFSQKSRNFAKSLPLSGAHAPRFAFSAWVHSQWTVTQPQRGKTLLFFTPSIHTNT